MATTASFDHEAPRWRRLAFSTLGAVTVGVLAVGFGAVFALLAPWKIVTVGPTDPHPELHRWHTVQGAAAFGLLFAGSLVALLRRPETKPVVAQFLAAGAAVFAAAFAFFDAESLAVLALAALVVGLYPRRRLLLANPWAGPRRVDRPRLALALLSAVLLAPDAARTLRWQIDGAGGEHAELTHWALAFALDLLLVLGGLLAAGRQPGAGALAALVGSAFLYLGVAALAIPDHDGSWGTTGGVLAALGGLTYLATALLDRRGDRLAAPRGAAAPAGQR